MGLQFLGTLWIAEYGWQNASFELLHCLVAHLRSGMHEAMRFVLEKRPAPCESLALCESDPTAFGDDRIRTRHCKRCLDLRQTFSSADLCS